MFVTLRIKLFDAIPRVLKAFAARGFDAGVEAFHICTRTFDPALVAFATTTPSYGSIAIEPAPPTLKKRTIPLNVARS